MSGDLVEVRLDGPGKNALGTAMMTRVTAAIDAAGGRPLLLVGAGDAFSAGLDLREIAELDAAGMTVFLRGLQGMTERLFRYPGPTVACVNGHAIAGGAILAIACDHAVATSDPSARIGLNEVALGLRFPPGVLEIVRYRIARLEPVVLGAGLFAPADAVRVGLIDEVADDPLAVARARLGALAAHPRDAYAHAKAALRARVDSDNPAAEAAFARDVLPAWTSDELKATIRGFLSRRRGP